MILSFSKRSRIQANFSFVAESGRSDGKLVEMPAAGVVGARNGATPRYIASHVLEIRLTTELVAFL